MWFCPGLCDPSSDQYPPAERHNHHSVVIFLLYSAVIASKMSALQAHAGNFCAADRSKIYAGGSTDTKI